MNMYLTAFDLGRGQQFFWSYSEPLNAIPEEDEYLFAKPLYAVKVKLNRDHPGNQYTVR